MYPKEEEKKGEEMGEKGGENKEETRGIEGEIEKNGDRWWPRRNGEIGGGKKS